MNKNDMTEKQEKLLETMMFFFKFLAVGLVFRLILWIYPDTWLIQAFFADLIGAMLGTSGVENIVEGIYITTRNAEYLITQDCLGWKSIAVFIALIFASTKRTLEHFHFIVKGGALLILANILRVYTTVLLAEKGIISFNIIHDTLWTWSLTLIVLIIWTYWLFEEKDKLPLYQRRIQEQVEKLRDQR